MLQSITWSQYLLFVGSFLGLYYLLLFVWMAKQRLVKGRQPLGGPAGSFNKKIWKPSVTGHQDTEIGGNIFTEQPPSFSPGASAAKTTVEEENKQLMPQVHDMLDEIQALFEAVKAEPDKKALQEKLYQIIHKYPALINSPFRSNISTMIAVNSENECAIHLSGEEISALWQ